MCVVLIMRSGTGGHAGEARCMYQTNTSQMFKGVNQYSVLPNYCIVWCTEPSKMST